MNADVEIESAFTVAAIASTYNVEKEESKEDEMENDGSAKNIDGT